MTSFRKLEAAKVLKRADSYKVRFQDIVIIPGFNTRAQNERTKQHIKSIYQTIMDGRAKDLPDLVVFPMEGEKVGLVGGHCRHAAYEMAIKDKGPIFDPKDNEVWLRVKDFEGDEADRKAYISTSDSALSLEPLERAKLYKDMRDEMGLGPEEIAVKVRKTRQHVDQMLHLADAAPEVQGMVADGTVSATEAMKAARQHGDKAAEVLGQAAAKAGKVTAAALKPWTPPARYVAPLVATVDQLVAKIPGDVREQLLKMENTNTLDTGTVSVRLPAAVVFQLLDQHFGIGEERAKAEERQRGKAADAAQGDLAGGAE